MERDAGETGSDAEGMTMCVGEVVAVTVAMAVVVVLVVWAGALTMVVGVGCWGGRKRC